MCNYCCSQLSFKQSLTLIRIIWPKVFFDTNRRLVWRHLQYLFPQSSVWQSYLPSVSVWRSVSRFSSYNNMFSPRYSTILTLLSTLYSVQLSHRCVVAGKLFKHNYNTGQGSRFSWPPCLECSSNVLHSLFIPLFSLKCLPLLPQLSHAYFGTLGRL